MPQLAPMPVSPAPSFADSGPAPCGVLIVDDSVVARMAMARIIDASDRFVVLGAVGDVAAARAFLARTRVDIILLDIALPGIDGLTALPDLLADGQGARILVVSSAAADGAAATLRALALGATDSLVKPDTGAMAARFAGALLDRLSRLVDGASVSADAAPPPPATVHPLAIPDFDILAIGGSTGGIHALSSLLRDLPPELDVPILVTQHLPAAFMPFFAAQLASLAGRPCDIATDLMRVQGNRIIVAPGDAHLRCVPVSDGIVVRLSRLPSACGCMPSVDPMFASLASGFGRRALCIVLSGMGRDGLVGARQVAAAGGTILVQDRATSVVWGMPGAIAEAGVAAAVLPPAAIARLIARRKRPA